MLIKRRLFFSILFIFVFWSLVSGFERRKEQFLSEPSYMILPLPYSMPGLGEGFMFVALAGNAADTNFDAYIVGITGDMQGVVIGLQDFHLVPETVILGYDGMSLNKATVQFYDKRGMDTEIDEFNYYVLDTVNEESLTATLSLFDRRFEWFIRYGRAKYSVVKILNSDAELIQELDEPSVGENKSAASGILLDITDDRQDPYKGVRIQFARQNGLDVDEKEPEYYVDNIEVSFFLPLFESSTFAVHGITSDAVVNREGNTDKEVILQELFGNSCPSYDFCGSAQQSAVDQTYAARKYGTARNLGGDDLMRAYPMMRFQGAHMRYLSAELRWNFATDITPIDFWIFKDVATGFQLALFHETGSVADLKEDLGDGARTSSGAGLRMISASGYVYRFDIAGGDEGTAFTIMFGYPW